MLALKFLLASILLFFIYQNEGEPDIKGIQNYVTDTKELFVLSFHATAKLRIPPMASMSDGLLSQWTISPIQFSSVFSKPPQTMST